MPWVSLIVAGGSALLNYAGNKAASDAQQKGFDQANTLTREQQQQQQRLTQQQLELNRPLIQTRDSALNALQTLFGLPTTRGSDFNAAGGMGGNPNLVLLPGITTTGAHSKQTKTNGPLGINTFGSTPLVSGTTPTVSGGAGAPNNGVYYDRYNDAIVDANGNIIRANASQSSGDLAGLVSGFNNGVQINNGTLYGVGSKGPGSLNLQLTPLTAEQKAAFDRGPSGGAGGLSNDRNALLAQLMNTPGINFVDSQGRQALERQLAAGGQLNSGFGLNAAIQRASDFAATKYNDLVLNPLFKLAGFGQQGAAGAQDALTNQGNSSNASSNALANLALNAAGARASSFGNMAQTGNDLLSNLQFIYGTQPRQPAVNPSAAGNAGFSQVVSNLGGNLTLPQIPYEPG